MALLFTALLLLLAALVGTGTVRKMIEVYETKHELKQGSAGFFRMIRGWSRIGFWLLITWFLASVMGDWHRTDDLGGAIDRAQLRLYVIMEILAALAESDN